MGRTVVPDRPEHLLKVPVVRRPEYTIHLEQADRWHCFVHCDVHARWTPRIKSALMTDWETLQALHGGPFHALHDPGDHKHLKFLRMFGITVKVKSYVDPRGRPKEIFST